MASKQWHPNSASKLLLAVLVVCCAVEALAAQDAPLPVAGEQSPATAESAHVPSESPGPVDFLIDIQPILVKHCSKCHGAAKRSGGLRLDTREFAEAGGDSGNPVLGGTPETNEILARVTSGDRSHRMPKNAPALSDQEIATLRQWVAEGTPWALRASKAPRQDAEPFYNDWLLSVTRILDRYKVELRYARPYVFVFLAIQMALLMISRAKAAIRGQRAWTQGRAAAFCRLANRISARELLLAWLLSVAVGALVVMRGHDQKLSAELAAVQLRLERQESPWSKTIFGSPPVPVRPDHPAQIAGTYYRGNCERSKDLFNGGNYLTAVFRVGLCDSRHRALSVGSEVPADGLQVLMELDRAPGTTDTLYSKELMASVFLTEQVFEESLGRIAMPITRLETLEEGRRWVAYVPLAVPREATKLSGLIYVYTGRVEGDEARGTIHYGIKYDLAFESGKLAAGSEVWMNSFGNSAVALPEPAGKIPYREWFDFRPLPIIEGENTKDPKLLGVDEYVKKGLIPPPPAAAPPANEAAPPRE